jgi:Uma2 family endonuclease
MPAGVKHSIERAISGQNQVAIMNVAVINPAPGLPPRRAFNVDDIRRMIDVGVLGEGERIELVEGEIVVMAAKSVAHHHIQNALNIALAKAVPEGLFVGNGSTLQLAEDVLVEPDLALISRSIYEGEKGAFAQARAEQVPLVIEIAVSSMAYDRGVKARLYAHHGIREYWVIDTNQRVTWIHTGPSQGGWSSIVECGPDDVLATPALPGFAIKLAGIG